MHNWLVGIHHHHPPLLSPPTSHFRISQQCFVLQSAAPNRLFIASVDNIAINIPSWVSECVCINKCVDLLMANRDSYDMTRILFTSICVRVSTENSVCDCVREYLGACMFVWGTLFKNTSNLPQLRVRESYCCSH